MFWSQDMGVSKVLQKFSPLIAAGYMDKAQESNAKSQLLNAEKHCQPTATAKQTTKIIATGCMDKIREECIIANHGFESASFLSNPWFNDATFACLH